MVLNEYLPENLGGPKEKRNWVKNRLAEHIEGINEYVKELKKNSGEKGREDDNRKILYLLRSRLYAQDFLRTAYGLQEKVAAKWVEKNGEAIQEMIAAGVSEKIIERVSGEPIIPKWEQYEDRMTAWEIYNIESDKPGISDRQLVTRYLEPRFKKKFEALKTKVIGIQDLYEKKTEVAYDDIVNQVIGLADPRDFLAEVDRRKIMLELEETLGSSELNESTKAVIEKRLESMKYSRSYTTDGESWVTLVAEYINRRDEEVVQRFDEVYRKDEGPSLTGVYA